MPNRVSGGSLRIINETMDRLTVFGNSYYSSYSGSYVSVLNNTQVPELFVGDVKVNSTYPGWWTQISLNNITTDNITITVNSTVLLFNKSQFSGENLVIEEDSSILSIGVRSRSNYDPDLRVYKGEGPYGAISRSSGTYTYIGASHGGLGSIYDNKNYTWNNLTYPRAYDDYKWPTEIGSTAACNGPYYAGGALLLNFSQIVNNGTIDASGTTGGASGGSIIIYGNFTNNGFVSADGGNSDYYCRALGGGGRIAIYYDVNSSLGLDRISASGGQDVSNYLPTRMVDQAGAGTIYLHNLQTGEESLIIKDGNTQQKAYYTTYTPIPSHLTIPIYVVNASIGIFNVSQTYSYINLTNSLMTHPPYPFSLNNYINATIGTLFMNENSSMNVTGMGYGKNYSLGPGLGPGAGDYYYYRGHGGGYGGVGGGSRGGSTYGILTNPVHLGSAGGTYTPYNLGGAGGGMILLYVNQALFENYTSLDASGEDGDSYGGGGSGGSILLFLRNASNIVYTFAIGGDSSSGGSGGGGRIAIYLGYNNSFNPAYDVSAGNGYYNGGVGTFYMGPYYYLDPVSLPPGPFNISHNLTMQVDLKVFNGTDFESYGSGQVWLYQREDEYFNFSSGSYEPVQLNFSYVGTYYEANLTLKKAGKKDYPIQGTYGPGYPILFLPYTFEVYGWYINMTKDQPVYIPNTMALVNVEAYYYPTYTPYEGNITFYYKGTPLYNMFINGSTTILFNVGSEAGFHELIAHID